MPPYFTRFSASTRLAPRGRLEEEQDKCPPRRSALGNCFPYISRSVSPSPKPRARIIPTTVSPEELRSRLDALINALRDREESSDDEASQSHPFGAGDPPSSSLSSSPPRVAQPGPAVQGSPPFPRALSLRGVTQKKPLSRLSRESSVNGLDDALSCSDNETNIAWATWPR